MGSFVDMKDISLRPKGPLMNLLEAVQNLESLPTTNRNSIIDRALDVALNTTYVNWLSVSEVSIENSFTGHIPTHIVLQVDEEKFSKVNAQIKEVFKAEKITIPYTLKLLLTLYFIHLKQQTDTANENSNLTEILMPDVKIDTLALKNEYDQSLYSGKKRLFEMCKVYLKRYPNVGEQLTIQSTQDLNKYIEFVDLNKYFSDKISASNPSVTYIAKVLAGIFILRVESLFSPVESKNILDHIVKQLEIEFQTIGEMTNQGDSEDYYKHIYAKMMGGKI